MKNNEANVTQAKPKVTGSAHWAPLGTTLPTSADAELANEFENLGYMAEDGITRSTPMSTTTVKAWGGDVVIADATKDPETFKFKLLEYLNTNPLKAVYGSDKVTGDLATGIKIVSDSEVVTPGVFVLDSVLKSGALERIVIPNGQLTALGDQTRKAGEPIAMDVTITTVVDSAGKYCYTYIKQPAKAAS